MARYVFRCTSYFVETADGTSGRELLAHLRRSRYTHDIEARFEMGKAPTTIDCDVHGTVAPRVFDFQFQEDRRRLRGGGISLVTGQPYAQTRAEERAIEQARGIEFVGPAEMPRQWREALEYRRHVDSGGERLPFEQVHAPEVVETRPLTSYMDEAGFRVGNAPKPTETQEQQLARMIASDPSLSSTEGTNGS